MSQVHMQMSPFDLGEPDEATEMGALRRAISLASGFRLIFVQCDSGARIASLMASLEHQLPALTIQSIDCYDQVTHLLDFLRPQVDRESDVLFVTGFEFSLPGVADAMRSPVIANLNASRNSFPIVVPFPMVLWLPSDAIAAISQAAPDFFSVRSGVYIFSEHYGSTSHRNDRSFDDPNRSVEVQFEHYKGLMDEGASDSIPEAFWGLLDIWVNQKVLPALDLPDNLVDDDKDDLTSLIIVEAFGRKIKGRSESLFDWFVSIGQEMAVSLDMAYRTRKRSRPKASSPSRDRFNNTSTKKQ